MILTKANLACLLLLIVLVSGANSVPLTKSKLIEYCNEYRRLFEDPSAVNQSKISMTENIQQWVNCVEEVEYMCEKNPSGIYRYKESDYWTDISTPHIGKLLKLTRYVERIRFGKFDCEDTLVPS